MFIGSNDDPAEVTTDLMQESTEEVEVTDDEDTGGMLSMSDRREHEENPARRTSVICWRPPRKPRELSLKLPR